ncbi:MAG: roadblock/LC7 domain-containing protein [Acidimicrobiia bacterium]|nr:roadblock/LC7 domain-containing protein [Acidimicrobiia bacterium]MDX2468042.1 roadblock/LC7 domain-containing protein [Acidimicrobiia bacterium]
MANSDVGSTLEERVTDVLRNMQMSSPDVIGAAVVDVEGFIIALAFPSGVNDDDLGAMSATLHGAGEQIAEQLMHAPMAQTYVKTDKGYVILNSVGAETVLALLANKNVKLGLVFLLLRQHLPELQRIIGD